MDDIEAQARLLQLDEIGRQLGARIEAGDDEAADQWADVSTERAALLGLDVQPPAQERLKAGASLEKLIALRDLMRELGLTQIAFTDLDEQ